MMRFSINQKMGFMGIALFLALFALFAVSRHENRMMRMAKKETETYREILKQRMSQLIEINRYEYDIGQMVLLARDALIKRGEGRVSEEKYREMIRHSEFILEKLSDIRKMTDDPDTLKKFKALSRDIPDLLNIIHEDLVSMIRENGKKEKENEAAFKTLHETIDGYGNTIEEILSVLEKELMRQLDNAHKESLGILPATYAKFHVTNIQRWLMEISATRARDGFDYGFEEAEYEMEQFQRQIKKIEKNAPHLKSVIESVNAFFESFYEKGKKMAGLYIEEGPDGGNRMLAEVEALAEDTNGKLESIIQRIGFAREMTLKMETAMNFLKQVRQAHFALMLAALEALSQKDSGTIDEELLSTIQSSTVVIRSNLNNLLKIQGTVKGGEAIRSAFGEYEKLFQAIQNDLESMIEKKGAEAGRVRSLFEQIGNEIDEKSKKIGNTLSIIRNSAVLQVRNSEKKVHEIETNLNRKLAAQFRLSLFIVSIISLTLVAGFFLFSRSITKPLRNIMKAVKGGAEQVAFAANEISKASQSMASGSSEQAASIEQISAALEEMSTMGRNTANLTDGVESLMKENIEKSAMSLKALVSMNRNMSRIESESDKISQIVTSIDNIAFQTNLLALNASVEAARAGESGAGFSVVAGEVRNLAARAAGAAEKTRVLLSGIITDIKQSAESIEQINKDFDGIISSATIIGEKTTAITEESGKVAEGIRQMGTAIREIDNVSQQTAATSEQAAAASEELNAQAIEMNKHVKTLNTLIHGRKKWNRVNTSGNQPLS